MEDLSNDLADILYNPLKDLTVKDYDQNVFENKPPEFTFLNQDCLEGYTKLIALTTTLYEIYPHLKDDKYTHSEVIYLLTVVLDNFPFWLLPKGTAYLVKLHLQQAKKFGIIHTKRLQAISFALKTLKESRILYPSPFQQAWLESMNSREEQDEF